MTSSRVPTLIDNLVAALQAASGLTDVKVVDGPMVNGAAKNKWVFIGYDGDPDGEMQAVTETQAWAGLGAKKKNEEILLTCCVMVLGGTTDVKTIRDIAYTILGEVEAVARTDIAQGMPTPTVCAITDHSYFQEQTADGMRGRLPFTLVCSTRI